MLPFLQFILAVGIIITAAKAGGYLSYRLRQPAVAGEVLAGLLLGPSLLNFLHLPLFTDESIAESVIHLSEVGVLLLMFLAGLELHLDDLAKAGRVAVLAGVLGFILTLSMGYLLATVYAYGPQQAIFLGLILAPTSVGISAQTLMELRALRSKVGTTLLGAATVDDVLGVLGVSLFSAFFLGGATGGLNNVISLLLEMSLFLIVASAFGFWLLPQLASRVEQLPISQGLVAFTFVIVLFYAWSAEAVGHLASVIGAFMAGLFLARSPLKSRIEAGFSSIAYGVFVPIFFANVGLSANLRQISVDGLLLLLGMVVVVAASKLLGPTVASRIGGTMTGRETLQLGFGMIPRGEVVLIVASFGIVEGIISNDIYSTVVVLVVLTTLLTPPVLRSLFAESEQTDDNLASYD
jgi:Kef-type K+ transport system membrane component KefB